MRKKEMIPDTKPKRLIVGIGGASGGIHGVRVLEVLKSMKGPETYLVPSPSAIRTLQEETDHDTDPVCELVNEVHSQRDIGAAISSGSFRTEGMLVAPGSVRTLSAIANRYASELLPRAADVCLKERRRVVLMVRETPLHAGHVDLLDRVTRGGPVVMPRCRAYVTDRRVTTISSTRRSGRRTIYSGSIPISGTAGKRRRHERSGCDRGALEFRA